MKSLHLPLLVLALVTAGCDTEAKDADPAAERDPAVTAALSDPLMTDPDLASQNQGGAALTGGGPASGEIPPDKRTPEEIEAAKAAALQVTGGALAPAPLAETTRETSRLAGAVTAPAIAAALGLGGKGCGEGMTYTAGWAARLSAPFDVYPRGHVGQAAGSDAKGCTLRVVGFVTPVQASDVLDFYATRAKSANYPLRRLREGEDDVLQGTRGGAGYAVVVRRRADGMTDAVIATAGI